MSDATHPKTVISSSLDSFEAASDWQGAAIDSIRAAIEITSSVKVRGHLTVALQNASRAQAFFLMETNRK